MHSACGRSTARCARPSSQTRRHTQPTLGERNPRLHTEPTACIAPSSIADTCRRVQRWSAHSCPSRANSSPASMKATGGLRVWKAGHVFDLWLQPRPAGFGADALKERPDKRMAVNARCHAVDQPGEARRGWTALIFLPDQHFNAGRVARLPEPRIDGGPGNAEGTTHMLGDVPRPSAADGCRPARTCRNERSSLVLQALGLPRVMAVHVHLAHDSTRRFL